MNKDFVNWGILGCAGIADRAVIPGIMGAKNAKLYAISSRSEKKLQDFKQKYNPIKEYRSYDELLHDSNVDAVYIPLPNSMHYKWVLKAAEMKKHILCEKPLGLTAKEVAEIKEVCDKNGVLFMEGLAYRHSPLTQKVKSLIDEGTIGKLKFMESFVGFYFDDLNDVRFNKDLAGGATYDIGCYNIDIIRHIAGSEPLSIYATGEIEAQSGVDEGSCIMMEFKDGFKAMSYCSFKCAERIGYTIIGELGILEVAAWFNAEGKVKITLKKKENTEEIIIDCPDNYMLEVEQFGRCILTGEKPLVTFEESLGNSKVIEEALKQIFNK